MQSPNKYCNLTFGDLAFGFTNFVLFHCLFKLSGHVIVPELFILVYTTGYKLLIDWRFKEELFELAEMFANIL